MRRTIKALVPVRSGSLRVKNKNTRPFCGKSLLEIRVSQLLSLSCLDGVVVSSNDREMLDVAERLGAEPHFRDNYFASNTVSMSEVYENMASSIECDDVMYALVTTPLVRDETFINAVNQYMSLPSNFDSISTVANVKEFLIKDGLPYNYDGSNIPRSQDLPDIMKLTFGVSILPRSTMVRRRSCLGDSPYFLSVGQLEGIDIDTEIDFIITEMVYAKIKNGLPPDVDQIEFWK